MSITKDFYTVFVLSNDHKPARKLNEAVFALRHGEEYKIMIINHHKKLRANASISVDGKIIGYFRINSDSSITIERPYNQERRLTFYTQESPEAVKAELDFSKQGILRVTIEQEQEQEQEPEVDRAVFYIGTSPTDTLVHDGRDDAVSIGGTGLGRASSQRFSSVSPMKTKDRVIVIRALMVVVHDESDIVPL